ncbi:MAG TPA: hypothetical protein VFQ44_06630 [Streptosporangiaceae bacterium]|nr:hypothetical protein [Streptosporangiaceae bacterium]
MPSSRRKENAARFSEQKVLNRPAPEESAEYSRSRIVGDFIILDWSTAYGTIGMAYSLTTGNSSARWLADAVYGQFWDHMHEVYTSLVIPQAATNLDLAPQLEAIDLYPGSRSSDSYGVTWRQLAGVLGHRAPWFDPALRDRDTICAWQPGDPAAIIPANHVELPVRPLLELAADEPDGSPAAAACLWLARHLRYSDAEGARQNLDYIRAAAADHENDCAYVDIAAVPAPLLRPDTEPPEETVLRAGWLQIVERRDVLAAAAARVVQFWDGGRAWPVGQAAEFDPASCQPATEWTARLRPGPAGQPPTVLERQLLQHVTSVDRAELLYDDASGCAAVRRTDHMGKTTVYASVPQRIGTVAPLAEVILSGSAVWIRTADGGLWLAPSLPGRGLSWGYSGGGPHALAALLGRLLDDITGPPVSGNDQPSPGLLSLIMMTPRDGTTVYTRAQLIDARRKPG